MPAYPNFIFTMRTSNTLFYDRRREDHAYEHIVEVSMEVS